MLRLLDGALRGPCFTDEETEVQRGPELAQGRTSGEWCSWSFTLGGVVCWGLEGSEKPL